MKPKYKTYIRINLVSLFFIIVSFISVTLAWFAYSGLADMSMDIGVKAWNIELKKDGQKISNDIVISLSEIYPGMETATEIVNINNLGDSDAQVKYGIVSARILGDYEDNYIVDDETTTSPYVEDVLSHEYPFHININLTKGYVLSKGEASSFEVSISWPLDSDDDALDSLWGAKAYDFQKNEQTLKDADPEYQIRPSIQVIIKITAEQYLGETTASDTSFNLGDTILFDVVDNQACTVVSSTCLETYVIDVNNRLSDETVTLLPNPNNIYLSGTYNDYNSLLSTITTGWIANTRPLVVGDLLKIVSTDIVNSVLARDDISDLIIGDLDYNNRMSVEIARAISYNGYYKFSNEKFDYLIANSCYWTNSEYDGNDGFAINRIDSNLSKIYNELKDTSCNVVPVIIANKINL